MHGLVVDWKTITFDWNHARAFLVTAEEGSLSAAARALKLTQSTLGRQVTALEEELGVSLFEKVGRSLEITPVGLELIEHVRTMGEAANKLSLSASGKSTALEGNVCISAAEAMAVLVLPPLLAKLRAQQPGIELEIIATSATSDLRRREADIAIRNVQPTHSELIARKLNQCNAYLYATPQYLQKIGSLSNIDELAHADYVGYDSNSAYLTVLEQIGIKLGAENFPYKTESHLTHWSIVKEGAAIGVMPDFVGDKEPLVQRVSDKLPPLPMDTWIVAHRELRTSRRIRTVFDYLVNELNALIKGVGAD